MRVTTDRLGDVSAGIAVPDDGAGAAHGRRPTPWGRAAALITDPRALPSLGALLAALARQGADQLDRVLLWTPVAFGLGAAAYLGLKVEPPLLIAAVLAAVVCVGAAASRVFTVNRTVAALAGLAAMSACGFLVAKLHSDAVAAPIAPAGLGVVSVEGWVVDIGTPSERGERLLIAPVHIARLAPAATPTRIRVVVAAPGGPDGAPAPGTAIRVATLLDPPPGPASPGAYDFARDAWFEGIGGVGLAMRAPVAVTLAPL